MSSAPPRTIDSFETHFVLWYYSHMRTTLRQARQRAGISMSDLAERLGVSLSSVSTLELNDEKGVAKTETVERALAALGLARFDIILPAPDLDAIVEKAERIAEDVGKTLTEGAVDEFTANLVLQFILDGRDLKGTGAVSS